MTQISQAERDKISNLLIPMDFPCFPPSGAPGSKSITNPIYTDKDYQSYATSKNVPAEFKGKIGSLPKSASGKLPGYEGTVSSESES